MNCERREVQESWLQPASTSACNRTPKRRERHVRSRLALLVLVFVTNINAPAATKLWDGGAASLNWSDATNWSPDGTPTSSDSVWLDNSATNPLPQISAQSGANCATLTVDGATAGTFLNYGGATPLVLNLYGASVNASNTGPLIHITTNAPASLSANKVNFRLQTSGELHVAAGRTMTFNNCFISQNGTRALTKTGAGTVAFGGSGSEVQFTGGLTVVEGTWNAGADTLDLPTSGLVTFSNASGVPAIITSGNSHSIAGLAGGDSSCEFYATGSGGLTLTGNGGTTFGGRLRGATKLTHAGPGTLTLTGNNTYTGTTTISNGTLALGASGSIVNSASILIATGATFNVSALAGGFTLGSGKTISGAGTVAGKLTAASSAVVSPGIGGVGTLTVTNGFTLAAGAHLDLDLNSAASYDTVAVTGGNVSLAGDLAGTTLGYTPAIGDTFYIVRNTGAGTTTGTLNGAGDGGKLDIGGKWFRVSFTSDFGGAGFQTNGAGNDMALQHINDPSPSGGAVAIVGAADEQVVQLQLSWLDNAGNETGFRVYRVLGDGSIGTARHAAGERHELYRLPSGTTPSARYAVQAFNAAGDLGDLTMFAPFQVGSTFEERRDYLLDWLSTDVPNLGQFGGGPHRIGRTGFWYGEARLLRDDTATGLSYIATAVEDASAENSNAGFSLWPGMDAYLRWNHLFSTTLTNRYREVYTTCDLYDNSATPNQRFMTCTASYLANGVWGSMVNSVSGASYGTGDVTGKAYLEGVINNVPWHGYPEHNSTTYLIYTLAPMLTLADFAPDPVLKRKARMAFEWGLAEAPSAMQNGRWVTPVTRGRSSATQNGYSNTSFAWWLLFGGPTPDDMLDSSNIGILASETFTGVLPELNAAGTERTQSYTRRTFAQRSAGPQLAYFKQTWMTPRYALCSQVEGTVSGFNADGSIILANLNTTAIQDGYQGQRWSLGWDDPPGADASLYISTPTTYSGTTSGISIYEDTLQREDTMIAVYNIPATGGTGGNNGDWPNQWLSGHIPAGHLAITDEATNSGRIFLHYNSVLVAVYLSQPFAWSNSFTTPCSKAGLAIETAPVSEYPQATAADRLAAFRADVLASAPDISAISNATPRFIYTNRYGHVLDLTYGLAGKIDGDTVDYLQWPMLEDPWLYQAQQGHLHLFGPNRTVTMNFYDWTQTTNHRPAVSAGASVPATSGTPVDVDLAAWVSDSETPDANLHFTLGAAENGTVVLLPDGHTARFTPTAGFSGAASFEFTAHDRGLHPRLIWNYDFEPPATLVTNSIRDASGTSRAATLAPAGAGTAVLVADSPAALGANGTRSLRLIESGTNAARLTRVVTPANLSMTNGSWTFATWFKRATRTNDDFMFYVGSGDGFSGNGDELHLHQSAGSDILRLVHYNAANAADVSLTSVATAPTNQWHHAAVTFERTADSTGTVRLYLNGALAGSATNVTWALRQDLPVVLGGHASTSAAVVPRYFNGWLDDAALFRGALSAGEIVSLAQQSIATFGGLGMAGEVVLSVSAVSLTPPQMAAPQFSGGQFQFQIDGATTRVNYTVQASTNLTVWTSLFTTNPAALPFVWSDTSATNYGARFYRVLVGP